MGDEQNIIDMLNSLSFVRNKNRKEEKLVALAKYKEMPRLNKPNDYHEKVEMLRGYRAKDPLFSALMSMVSHYAVKDHDWEYIYDDYSMSEQSDSQNEKVAKDAENIEKMWYLWDKKLNRDMPNFIPGTGFVDKWLIDDLAISGMSTVAWKWGEIGEKNMKFPTMMINFPVESVRLQREGQTWDEYRETIKVKKPATGNDVKKEGDIVPEAATKSAAKGDELKEDYTDLPLISSPTGGSFCLKHKWSPGGVVVIDKSQGVDLGLGLYPAPPFESCIPWLLLRESLISSDMVILDGLINYILFWKIGDKDMPPWFNKPGKKDATGKVIEESDFTQIKKLLEQYGAQKVMEVFLPWFVNVEFISPPTDTIVSKEKYAQSTAALLYNFGILSASGETGLDDFNPVGIEGVIGEFRDTICGFWDRLSDEIAVRNELVGYPSRRYAPLPFSRETVIEGILKGHEAGEISTETVNRNLGVDPEVEKFRVLKEVKSKFREIYNENVPVRFSQKTVNPDGTETQKTTETPGRPKGTKDKEKREPVKSV